MSVADRVKKVYEEFLAGDKQDVQRFNDDGDFGIEYRLAFAEHRIKHIGLTMLALCRALTDEA